MTLRCAKGHMQTMVFDHAAKRVYMRCYQCLGWHA
jgi:ribosomal protein S27E